MATVETEIVARPTFLAPPNSELTTKQNLFINYYLEHRNGVKAARLAGYSGDDNTLNQAARANLQNTTIREAIENYYRTRILSKDGVLAELSDIARSPWRDHVEVKYGDDGEVISAQLRLTDKIKALELTGKAQGMFADRSESVNINIDLKVEDLTDILQGALSAGAIDVTPLTSTPTDDDPPTP